MKKVCVVGLGYVGLPLLAYSKKVGYDVTGYDIDKNKILNLQKRRVTTDDPEATRLLKSIPSEKFTYSMPDQFFDYILVCVPTPVKTGKRPDYSYLEKAVSSIAERLHKGETIIIESTIAPGTTRTLVVPILERKGLKAGTDFYVAYCPERISPGDKWPLPRIKRILGALNDKSREKAREFYTNILEQPPHLTPDIETAELTKIYENMFRDVNIAFVNEIARVCDQLKIDVKEVISAATTKPFGFMPFYPGIGVGGHCIPVDPYYLIEEMEKKDIRNTSFFRLARSINDSMAEYIMLKLYDSANKNGILLSRSRAAFLGVTYKPNVDDIRESPALKLLSVVSQKIAEIRVYDPVYPEYNTVDSFEDAIKNVDIIILAVPHNNFIENSKKIIESPAKIIVDCHNRLNKKEIILKGKGYVGIGR